MRLHKALKLRKNLVGEITKLKKQIQDKNSYLEGDINAGHFNMGMALDMLTTKINELVGLKFAINEANQEIQSKIYSLSEYKALIAFWNTVPIDNGSKLVGYSGDNVKTYKVHITEGQRDNTINDFQKKVDALQEELDVYNYTTDIPWEEPPSEMSDENSNNTKWNVIPLVSPDEIEKLNEGKD